MMQTTIKLTLAILYFICLARMPYGYYQMVRFLSFVGLSVLAYDAYKKQKHTEMFIYAAIALLFQPFLKVALGRTLWNYVDVIVGIGLLLSLFVDRDKLNIRTTAKNKDTHNTNSLQKDSNKNYQEERKSTNA